MPWEIVNSPLNYSVVFTKADTIFTNDYWKAVIHIHLTHYEEAVEMLKHDLAEIIELIHFTSLIEEGNHVQVAVISLENKLSNLKQFLTKPDRSGGLINVGRTLFKILFGTAYESDVTDFRSTVTALNQRQGELVHALNQQITYFRQLDSAVEVDHMLIEN
jgi:hypothetical protein